MIRCSFQRLDSGEWGVKVTDDLGGHAPNMAGETVQITRRDGAVRERTLGARVTVWNGGRAALYTIARRGATGSSEAAARNRDTELATVHARRNRARAARRDRARARAHGYEWTEWAVGTPTAAPVPTVSAAQDDGILDHEDI